MTLTSGLPCVARVEDELAADRRHADAVAVATDAAHDAVDEVPRPGVGRIAEPERVEHRDRPRAHREDVAQDAADAGRGALVRLDGARVVVRLDLERDREPVPDRDDAGVLARPGDDALAGGRQRPEQRLRALVRAVLAPHDAEHRQLEVVRVTATEPVADRVELLVGHAETAMERLHGGAPPPSSRRPRPTASLAGGRARGALDERADDPDAVVRAEDRLGGALRMRHEPGHVAGRVHHAGDRPQRAVRVRGAIVLGRGRPAPST